MDSEYKIHYRQMKNSKNYVKQKMKKNNHEVAKKYFADKFVCLLLDI